MSLLGNWFKASGAATQQKVTVFAATHFPDITSQAQLEEFSDQVQQLSVDLETLRARQTSDKQALDSAQADFDRYANAGRTLLAQKASLKSDDPAYASKLSQIEEGITEATQALTKFKATLDYAKQRYAETQQDFDAKQNDLQKASDYLATMRDKLQDAQRDRERISDEQARQQARMREAKNKVGIGTSGDAAVLDAMTAANNKARIKVDGLRTAADAIDKAVTPKAPTGALADALKSSTPTKSADDQLKDLLGG